MASNQTLTSSLRPSATPPLTSPSTLLPSSSSLSSSPSSLSKSSNESGPVVGSLLAYEPYLLQPFLGLHSIDRPDDPWHHKAYDLHHPIYTGGGTFEQYLENGRYKRDLATAPSSQAMEFAKTRNTLTPQTLGRILHLKSNFKKHYPTLYKSMMAKLRNGKSTTVSVIPPEVPQQVSHKNLELAAAEINPLESLIHTYEEDLKKITETQKQQQPSDTLDSSVDTYRNEFNFWSNPREEIITDSPNKVDNFATPPPETVTQPSLHYEEPRFWEDPQNLLQQVEEEQTFERADSQIPPSEPPNYWERPEDYLKPTTEPQLVFKNPPLQIISKPPSMISRDKFEEPVNEEPPSFWENPQEALKDLIVQPVHFYAPQNPNTVIENNNLLEMPDEIQSDTNNDANSSQPNKIRTSENDDNNDMWEPSVLRKRSSNSFWAELEAQEDQQEHKKHHIDDLEPIFDFNEDFD